MSQNGYGCEDFKKDYHKSVVLNFRFLAENMPQIRARSGYYTSHEATEHDLSIINILHVKRFTAH